MQKHWTEEVEHEDEDDEDDDEDDDDDDESSRWRTACTTITFLLK